MKIILAIVIFVVFYGGVFWYFNNKKQSDEKEVVDVYKLILGEEPGKGWQVMGRIPVWVTFNINDTEMVIVTEYSDGTFDYTGL